MTEETSPDGKQCPICREGMPEPNTFYWVISPPVLSLFLSGTKRLYIELACCGDCYRKIRRRREITWVLAVVIPVAIAGAFYARAKWWPDVSEARFALFVAAAAFSVVTAAFAREGLDRVRVSDERLVEAGKRLSRQRLRIATPWFVPSLHHFDAERIDLSDDEASEK